MAPSRFLSLSNDVAVFPRVGPVGFFWFSGHFRPKLVISGHSGEIWRGEAAVGGSLEYFVFPVNSDQIREFLVVPPLRGGMKGGRLRISAFLPNSDDHRQRGRYCAVSENPIDSPWDGSVAIVGAWRHWVLSLVRCVGPACLRTNVRSFVSHAKIRLGAWQEPWRHQSGVSAVGLSESRIQGSRGSGRRLGSGWDGRGDLSAAGSVGAGARGGWLGWRMRTT